MSKFYANIMNGEEEVERCPEYFRVDFIGRGFPSFLQNKTFIYRGRGFERRGEFVIRIMDQFPDAEEKKKFINRLSKQTKRVTTINPKWLKPPKVTQIRESMEDLNPLI